jgi:hypothetical protein
MTLTDAELIAMWPSVPDSSCSLCPARHVQCTWSTDGNLRCEQCLQALRVQEAGR